MPAHSGRRRRMLSEELQAARIHQPADVNMDTICGMRYTDAANIENHPQVSDLIGRRCRSYVLVVAAAGAGITLLLVGHLQNPRIAGLLKQPSLPALDLASPGSLAAWVVSLATALLAPLCLLIYSLRRHRIDDYQARYRIWLVAAAGCLLVSVMVATRLHDTLTTALTAVTGWSPAGYDMLWLTPIGLLAAWIGVRLGMELRECRIAIALLAAATLGLVASVVSGLGPRIGVPAIWATPLAWGTAMSAVLAFGLALNVFARFVVLDVQGLIEHRTGRQVAPTLETCDVAEPIASETPVEEQEDSAAGGSSAPTAWVDGSEGEVDDEDQPASSRKKRRKKSGRQKLRRAA